VFCNRSKLPRVLTSISRFTATVPTVIQGLGYTSANAQLLTIPIYVCAMIVTVIFCFVSDRMQSRTPFIMAGYMISVVGFIAQLAIPHDRMPGLVYGFLFPVATGLYAPVSTDARVILAPNE